MATIDPADVEPAHWGILLAGGEGLRLRPLTRIIAGDDRPKQFCPLVSDDCLLTQTRRRAARIVSEARTLVVLTRAHESFYDPLLADVAPDRKLVQPLGRGTGIAILYASLRVARVDPAGSVVVLPCDHFVSDDARFMAHVGVALQAVRQHGERTVLLGVTAEHPEVEYGWIEPGEPLHSPGETPLFRVRRFWEKPTQSVADTLFDRGCLWNTFVLVSRVAGLLRLIQRAAPDAYRTLADLPTAASGDIQPAALEAAFGRLPDMDFSRTVLWAHPDRLAVLPVSGVAWSDLGEAGRALEVVGRLRSRPRWARGAPVGAPR